MGTSMKVYPITDDRIAELRRDPSGIRALVGSADECYLGDYWDCLHFVLTGEAGKADLPLGALKCGDVTLEDDDPVHAIVHSTTFQLSEAMGRIEPGQLRERFDPAVLRQNRVRPSPVWSAEYADENFAELLWCFERLRSATCAAAANGAGLLFVKFEDW